MKKTIRISVMAALAAGIVAGAPVRCFAQQELTDKLIPSLEYQQADVREALEALFKDVNLSYSIAPEVQGQVTVSMHNIGFSVALQNILRQVDATYRITGGVFEIVKREAQPDPTPTPGLSEPTSTDVVRRIKVLSGDPELIALLIGSKQGNQTWSLPPELSSLRKGGAAGTGGMGSGGMGGRTSGGAGGFGSMGGGTSGAGGLGSMGGGASGFGGLGTRG